MAKVFFEKEVMRNGVMTLTLFNVTTPAGDQGTYVTSLCKGLPFWWFSSIPSGKVIACDFTNAPVAANTASANNALIAGIAETPADVLTYE